MPADPVQVAHERRLIEPELLPQSGKRVLPRGGAEHDGGRIAGQDFEDQEDRQRDAQQCHGERDEAGDDETQHEFTSRLFRPLAEEAMRVMQCPMSRATQVTLAACYGTVACPGHPAG